VKGSRVYLDIPSEWICCGSSIPVVRPESRRAFSSRSTATRSLGRRLGIAGEYAHRTSRPQADASSLVAICPAEPRARAVVTAGKAVRRPVVPVAIERGIPRKIACELDVIRDVHVELDTAGLRDGWHESSLEAPIGPVESEELQVRTDQARP
jgi:hypothetical protein